jgi:prepilin-type N-terminal cleavage/methylation domain-containing protein
MKQVSVKKSMRKNVKGMTLVEIIIAMVVFAVIAMILVHVGGTVNTLTKRANHINKKTSIEGPMIENAQACLSVQFNKGYDDAAKTKRNYQKDSETVTALGGCLEAYNVDARTDQASPLRVTMEYDGTPVHLNAAVFTASPAISASDKNSTESAGDLKYIYVSTKLTSGGNAIWVDDHPLGEDGDASGEGGKTDTGNGSTAGSNEVKPALPDDKQVGNE